MSKLRQLRLGEYLAIGWILFFATVYTVFHKWSSFRLGDTLQVRLILLVFIITLFRYLVPILLISIRKLSLAVSLLFSSKNSLVVQEPIGFDREIGLMRLMLVFLRDSLPLYLLILFYPSTNSLVDILRGPVVFDDLLARLDLMIFHIHLSVWMERFISPWLSELLSLCYSVYLALSAIILLYICLYRPRTLFLEATQGFMLMSIIGFIGYILIPAVGPQYTLTHLYTRELFGSVINHFRALIIEVSRAPRDVFPSLHVGISAMMLVYAWRANKKLWLFVLPFTIGNWIATIYLRYHYTIDVVVSLLLVPLIHETVRLWMRKFPETESEAVLSVEAPAPAFEGFTAKTQRTQS